MHELNVQRERGKQGGGISRLSKIKNKSFRQKIDAIWAKTNHTNFTFP